MLGCPSNPRQAANPSVQTASTAVTLFGDEPSFGSVIICERGSGREFECTISWENLRDAVTLSAEPSSQDSKTGVSICSFKILGKIISDV
jgi:hypothetical protein